MWKNSEKLPSQVKRGDGSNVRGKNREELDCFLLGKDAHTRSTKNEHVRGHVSNGSEIYLEVSLCHILGHIYNLCFDICVFFSFPFPSKCILCFMLRTFEVYPLPDHTVAFNFIRSKQYHWARCYHRFPRICAAHCFRGL